MLAITSLTVVLRPSRCRKTPFPLDTSMVIVDGNCELISSTNLRIVLSEICKLCSTSAKVNHLCSASSKVNNWLANLNSLSMPSPFSIIHKKEHTYRYVCPFLSYFIYVFNTWSIRALSLVRSTADTG